MAPLDDQDKLPRKSIPLRALLIEDNPDDAELCRRVLTRTNPNIQTDVVANVQEFTDRIRGSHYDVVLSDFALGKWTAQDALELLRKENLDIPFILVTGTLGEEKAVECIKNGMSDFILKDRLERLPFAISRAIEEKLLRDGNRSAENLVRESEAKFRALADALPAAIFIEEQGQFRYANRAAEEITGYSRDELFAMGFSQLVHRDSKDAFGENLEKRDHSAAASFRIEVMIQPKKREPRWLDLAIGTFLHDGALATLTTAFDVTERRRADRAIQYDVATGLPNRTHLTQVFDTETSRTRRTGHTFSLLVLYLEGMTQIQRKRGQLAAAQTLHRAARTTRLHCRSLDTVARTGAEQLALLLPETDLEGALILGGRIAERITRGDPDQALSCRYAASSHPKDGDTLEELLKATDYQIRSTAQR